MESEVSRLLNKMRRAKRNNTGVHFSFEELKLLARLGVVHVLAKAEADEIVGRLFPEEDLRPESPAQDGTRGYSVKSLALHWQCSEGLVRNMISRGELKAWRHGGLIRITPEAVREVEERRN